MRNNYSVAYERERPYVDRVYSHTPQGLWTMRWSFKGGPGPCPAPQTQRHVLPCTVKHLPRLHHIRQTSSAQITLPRCTPNPTKRITHHKRRAMHNLPWVQLDCLKVPDLPKLLTHSLLFHLHYLIHSVHCAVPLLPRYASCACKPPSSATGHICHGSISSCSPLSFWDTPAQVTLVQVKCSCIDTTA